MPLWLGTTVCSAGVAVLSNWKKRTGKHGNYRTAMVVFLLILVDIFVQTKSAVYTTYSLVYIKFI